MDLDLYNKHRENAKKLLLCILSDFKDYFLHEDSNKSNKEFLYIRLIAYNNKTIYDPIVYKFEQTEEMLNELDRLSQRNDAETELKGEINAINKIHTTSLPGQSTFVFHFCNGYDEKNDHVSNNEVSSDIREIDELKYEIIFLSESNKNDKVCEKLSNLIDFDVSVL